MPTFYMCPPKYFEIEYAINIWTDLNERIDHAQAQAEWDALCRTYRSLGARVIEAPAVAGAIELTFLGDSIFLFGAKAVPGRFRHSERQGEVAASTTYFKQAGFAVQELPENVFYEGNGDSMYWNGKLLGGYGVRSDLQAYDHISALLDLEVVPLNILKPFFHLDLALCPIDADTLAYYPPAFTAETQATIDKLASRKIRLPLEEVMCFALNGKAVGDAVILNGSRCPMFMAELDSLGIQVIQLDTAQFNKAGGGAKCLTLEHYLPA